MNGFLRHVGPIERIGPTTLQLELARHHLNFGGRLHGGMVMTLVCAGAETIARDSAAAPVELVALDVQFVVAVQGAGSVEVQVECSRSTRTLVFLRIVLWAASKCLATGSAIYRVLAQSTVPPLLTETPPLQGWRPVKWTEPFSAQVGLVYERTRADGLDNALFQADATRSADAATLLHDAVGMFVADIFCGRVARAAGGGRCVTLAMQVRRLGDVSLGDWVEMAPQVRLGGSPVLHVDGSLCCGGRPVLAVASVWKLLGAS